MAIGKCEQPRDCWYAIQHNYAKGARSTCFDPVCGFNLIFPDFYHQNGTPGGILICRDWDWVNCTYTVQPLNTCIVMNQIWNDTVSSLGPDNGTVVCIITYLVTVSPLTICVGNCIRVFQFQFHPLNDKLSLFFSAIPIAKEMGQHSSIRVVPTSRVLAGTMLSPASKPLRSRRKAFSHLDLSYVPNFMTTHPNSPLSSLY